MKVKIKKLKEEAVIPQYAKEGDAGLDLIATSKEFDNIGNIVYGTGLSIEIPIGYVGLLFPRSSISKYTLSLTNSVGVIDSGYRGEIMCKLKPTAHFTTDTDSTISYDPYQIGDKVCQLIIIPYPSIEFEEVTELSDSARGAGGYGSTGN